MSERQIQAFEASTTKEFRSILEYVQPILTAETLTREIFRTEYQIKTKFRAIYKLTRKYRSKKREGAMSISSVLLTSPSPEPGLFKIVSADGFGGSRKRKGKVIASPLSNIKELAKAKVRAHQKLIGRLLKEDSLLDRPSMASSRSVSPFPGSYEL